MTLTSTLLIWLLWLAALGLLVWSIIAWPRSAGPGPLAIVRRVAYHLGVIVLVLLAVGVSLNSQYGWYANWSDLASSVSGGGAPGTTKDGGNPAAAAANIAFPTAAPGTTASPTGTGPNRPAISGGVTVPTPNAPTPTKAAIPTGPIATPVTQILHHTAALTTIAANQADLLLHKKPGSAGQYFDATVPGPISGMTGKITVWLPQSYFDPAHKDHRFAVLEAFHGIPGNSHQLSQSLGFASLVNDAIQSSTLVDTVVVMPTYQIDGADTECVNGGAGQPQAEDWLSADVTGWIEQNLRVSGDRRSWATWGFSAGAYCASMLTMLHPALFSAAISLGGYFKPTFEPAYVPFAADSPQGLKYDLVRLAKSAPPPVALWVQTSPVDPVSYGTSEDLLKSARPPLSVTEDVLPNAGHRIAVWVALIPTTLGWLGKNIPGFAPGPLT